MDCELCVLVAVNIIRHNTAGFSSITPVYIVYGDAVNVVCVGDDENDRRTRPRVPPERLLKNRPLLAIPPFICGTVP